MIFMFKNKKIKNTILFICLVIADIAIIQFFRFITPVIIMLRLSFYFIVISVSIFVYYYLTKPKNIIRTGIIFSIICFIIALSESYIVHVLIEKGHYRLLYLIPSSFALVLPFLIAIIFKFSSQGKD